MYSNVLVGSSGGAQAPEKKQPWCRTRGAIVRVVVTPGDGRERPMRGLEHGPRFQAEIRRIFGTTRNALW